MAAETIQACLDLFQKPSYLEIGVQDGFTFHAVRAERKVAVDPVFRFNLKQAKAEHRNAEYHQVPSDDFFAGYNGSPFDVVFIDGLHTAEQTLRDLLNVTQHTRRNSIIVVDDILPDSYASSLPVESETFRLKNLLQDPSGAWMGDVYKLVFFIETFMQQYSFASPIGGNPHLVMWRKPRATIPHRTLLDVANVDFARLRLEEDRLRRQLLAPIIAEAKAAGAGGV